jgi:hypothetical protein
LLELPQEKSLIDILVLVPEGKEIEKKLSVDNFQFFYVDYNIVSFEEAIC